MTDFYLFQKNSPQESCEIYHLFHFFLFHPHFLPRPLEKGSVAQGIGAGPQKGRPPPDLTANDEI